MAQIQHRLFLVKGKVSAWDTWNSFPEVTPALKALFTLPDLQTVDNVFPAIEWFIILLYERTSSQESVNEAREYLYTCKNRQIEYLPPTSNALYQHVVLRTALQAGHV